MAGHHHNCRRKTIWSRRDFLFQSGGGIAGVALADLLQREGLLAAAAQQSDTCAAPVPGNPFAPKPPHFAPRATAVISLFMSGGVSQVDTFDPKPALERYAGEPLADSVVVRQGHPGPLMPSPFAFRKHGESGIDVSEIFPHLARKVDGMAFIRSLYGRSNDHIQATYEMQSGQIRMGFPGRRIVGHLRPRLGEREPAGVRGDERPSRRSARRPERLERRVHAGDLPGDPLPRRR